MKLYVWTEVLMDYTYGMIVSIAPDLESALASCDTSYVRAEMGEKTPLVIDLSDPDVKAQTFWVYGGG